MPTKKAPKPCQVEGCNLPKMRGVHRCAWHWLLAQPIEVQERAATKRLSRAEQPHRARVDPSEAPDGHRWCAGCQSWVPLFYASGSRCRACASRARHRSHVARTYDLPAEDYEALLRAQGGRCALCRRVPRSRRLAVDHDHETGRVRGLLCADDERGCNHAVLGVIESASVDGGLAMAERIVEYLVRPPYARLTAQNPAFVLTRCPQCGEPVEDGACTWSCGWTA